MSDAATVEVEQILREELARGDVGISTTVPILRHLIANDDHALFSDEIVARVRGMISDLSRQLLFSLAEAGEIEGRWSFAAPLHAGLRDRLTALPELLGHVHSLALEYQFANTLARRAGVDPVLTPLLQDMVASSQPGRAATAMQALTAQSRFFQNSRRMELPVGELPGDLFRSALLAMRSVAGEEFPDQVDAVDAAHRAGYDEGPTRLGLLERLLSGPGGDARQALSVTHAGVALFATALSFLTKQDRALAVLSLNGGQLARLAVALRAAGWPAAAIEELLLVLHPDHLMPEGLDSLSARGAATLLAQANPMLGS